MKNQLNLIALFFLLGVFFISGTNKTLYAEFSPTGIWINTTYSKCMENNLPCECEKKTKKYIYLKFENPDKYGTIYAWTYHSGDLEPKYIQLKKLEQEGCYEVFSGYDILVKLGSIKLSQMNLEFKESNKDEFLINFVKGGDDFDVENVKLIDSGLAQRKCASLEAILDTAPINCYCNKWSIGGNVIYLKNSRKSWLLEVDQDSLYIYSLLDTSIVAPPLYIKSFYKKSKWK